MTEDILSKTYNLFEELVTEYKNLLQLLLKEKEQIIYEELSDLTQTIILKEEILANINSKKEEIKENIKLVKNYFGFEEKDGVTFAKLISFMSDNWKVKFEEILKILREYNASIRTVSIINNKLVDDTMKFVNIVIDFLKNGDGEVEIYTNKGFVEKKSNELNFLDVQL